MFGSSILRFEFSLSLLAVVTLTACGLAVPPGAYQPESGSAQYFTIGRSLTRAAIAAGENPENYKFGFIRSSKINAANSGAGTFYFSDGLAAQPQEVIDAVVAHEVAHEVLGHVGQAILTRLAISTAFAVGGIFVPGLQYADYAVNPLVANAFDRAQEIEADQKAVQILGNMGYGAPEQVMLAALTKFRNLYGSGGGGLLDTHPNIDDRIAEIAKSNPCDRRPRPLECESRTSEIARAPSVPGESTSIIRAPPSPASLHLLSGKRVEILTRSGEVRSGTLVKAEQGEYMVQMAEETVTVNHADVAELRYYGQRTAQDREFLREFPMIRLRRVDGSEITGWIMGAVEDRYDRMYEITLLQDETILFIRKSRVVSMVRTGSFP